MTHAILCASQPIYDSGLNLVAHELLFRDDESGKAHILNADQATSNVLLNAFTSIQSATSTGKHPVFVNITRNLIFCAEVSVSIGSRLVFEYSAEHGLDAKLVAAIIDLSKKGFNFAICNVADWRQHEDLLTAISYVKVNALEHNSPLFSRNVTLIKRHKVRLIAEKVEGIQNFEACKDAGCEHFQGYFLTKPQIIKGQKLDTRIKVVLELVQELQNPETSLDRIEQLIMRDAALSFKLLRIINSAAFSMPRKIARIRDAVVFLGLDHIRFWVTLITISTLDVKSDILIPIQLVRARMCELLAETNEFKNPRKYFMVGLFSMLDAMLDMEMSEILTHLPLEKEITEALINMDGEMGAILQSVIAYEKADWASIEEQKISEFAFGSAYLESLQWVQDVLPSIN